MHERAFDALWEAELSRYCHRCDRLLRKCVCGEMETDLADRWDEMVRQAEHDHRTEEVEDGKPYGSGGSIYLEDE